ncbi:site-specific integrase [Ferruginibacter sp. HRS2-29]|uniref:site-specific integrase n=1 Tax=Ferruginibacter sp. HRS2-29 TaxID=2487334 RepID=UPI0020CE7F12|nr:site-specific integrase [Ferruginibacter sp. HRS2-29]MCP9750535.1 site-specific integrase [Ferruginibacter sp. HRS2-29]
MGNIKTLFWLYKSKMNKKGEAPLYLRITSNGKKVEIASGYYLNDAEWDAQRKQAKGKSENSKLVNNYIAITTTKILQIQNEFSLSNNSSLTANVIKQRLLGVPTQKKNLLEVFEYHNAQIKKQVGKGKALGTLNHYEVSKGKIIKFLKHCYNATDIALDEISHKFLTDFESFLKLQDGLSSNSAMKKLTHLKTVIKLAIANEWTTKNPFGNFKCTYKNPTRDVLTKEELQLLGSKVFLTDRLTYVRDIFLFCCYTGLRYSDVGKLTPSNIYIGEDGKRWLTVDTTKTNERCNIPLFEQAERLIEKYKDNKECLYKGVLFPIRSNQKMNEFLKEIATLTGINKNLHFHLSRHTFATTIMLANGFSIESVGKMLGQKNIRTTQIYAKMTDGRISTEMALNRSKIEVFAC